MKYKQRVEEITETEISIIRMSKGNTKSKLKAIQD